jgi:hypothetical protein
MAALDYTLRLLCCEYLYYLLFTVAWERTPRSCGIAELPISPLWFEIFRP